MPNAFLNVGMLIPITGNDLNANDLSPSFRPGGLSFVIDAFGARMFQYCRVQNGSSMVQGELASKVGDVATTNITSGTTTSAAKAASWTADKHVGMLLYVDDNDDSAGGAPEGEVGIIISNTAAEVKIDPARPFSLALAANDETRVIALYHAEDAADGDEAGYVLGVVVGLNGISDTYYGWIQNYGVCPDALHKASDVAAGGGLVADAASVGPWGTDAAHLWVGHQLGTFTAASHDSNKAPVFLNLFGAIGGA